MVNIDAKILKKTIVTKTNTRDFLSEIADRRAFKGLR